jgi:SAM-dependent methyltransferase
VPEDAQTGQGKADFSHIYDRPDPRAYFRTLGELDYQIPQRARPVFDRLLDVLRARRGASAARPLRALDLCCSYGVNAALLRCEVALDDLFSRYSSAELDGLSPTAVCELDRSYYAERRRADPVQVTGLDTAANAVDYGCRAGLLDSGWTEDLEAADPSPRLTTELGRVDLVVSTGGIGYVTHRTLGRVARSGPGHGAPWVAAFVLRQISYERIGETLAGRGLVTEHLDTATFPQRRFASEGERESALRALEERGVDPTGLEDEGRYYADFYLSRPSADVQEQPLTKLLDGVVP